MTALYIALKVHNQNTVMPESLSELSRGQITAEEILTMETIMLTALSFNLCPPTFHSYIDRCSVFLPPGLRNENTILGHFIMDYATFLTEMSVMDLSMRGMKPSHIVYAALLNVLDGIDESAISKTDRNWFLSKIEESLGIWSGRKTWEVKRARKSLWHVSRRSAFTRHILHQRYNAFAKKKEKSSLQKTRNHSDAGYLVRARANSSVDCSPVCIIHQHGNNFHRAYRKGIRR